MRANRDNPLTPALRELLRASHALRTTDAKTLAARLNRSPATVRTQFQRILAAMNCHSRYAALSTAEACGWLAPRPDACALEMYADAVLILPDPPVSLERIAER
jgi:hypothetical protein